MIRLFAIKTLRQVFLEAKLVAAAALVVILFGVGSLLAVGQHREAQRAYAADVERTLAESNLDRLLLVRPPHPLDFVAGTFSGPSKLLGVGPSGIQEVATDDFKGSFLSIAQQLDWLHVIAVLLSLLAIFVSYDAVSGERENGTLRLILAQPVGRSSFLIGSSFGLLCVLLLPLLLGIAIGLLVLELSPGYELGLPQLAAVGAIVFLGALYLAFFVFLSVLISSLCRHSATALIWLILFWLVLVVILPSNGGVLASLVAPPPQYRDETEKVAQIERNYEPPLIDYYHRMKEVVDGGVDEHVIQDRLDQLRDRIVAEQVQRLAEKKRLLLAVHEEFARRRLRHLALARATTIVSPAVLLKSAVERLLTTGESDYRSFLSQARDYQRTLAEPIARGQQRHLKEAQSKNYWQAMYSGFKMTGVAERTYIGVKPDSDLIPPFLYRRPGLAGGLAAASWTLLALITISGLLFLAALRVFARYDVR
ncbi:MAG TPA: ABC transporter permease subunit [Thermoanaerobaculia bacterium]|nr:ABC transporter permease subunit [Thermoanaerobaculia bacterium]